MINPDKKANNLLSQTSPYLLQHAYNPVNWFPWGEEALSKAIKEDKPIILSIGYSACHWCHVMERECFENDELAKLMNDEFICIKVDREERPDVDAIYMDAVHAMGVQGGWPLNVFLAPSTKPFFGGTYFPPQQWRQILTNIAEAYKKQKSELINSAESFAEHLNISDIKKYNLQTEKGDYNKQDLDNIFLRFEANFDNKRGGTDRAPKFPMPSIYFFLLRYYHLSKNEKALNHIKLTLNNMAYGGIYDQIGGGFSRYSVDENWFAPHFEKMLYDNGQLVSLYSEAFLLTKLPLYKEIVYDTISWLKREMINEEGAFYSALDADSEGVEGKFYVWTIEEWNLALKEIKVSFDKNLLNEYWNVSMEGNWEHGVNILHRSMSESDFAKINRISVEDFTSAISNLKKILLIIRSERIRPGLDDKILCSWNGLMLKGLIDAYRAFDEENFLTTALKNAYFLKTKMGNGNQLWHTYKNNIASINGFLEDYAFVIDAYIALYQVTFDKNWLSEAENLSNYVINNFYDEEEETFFFTDKNADKLIARKKEIFDNVIPASNSAMAKNLYFLGKITENQNYLEISSKMMGRLKSIILKEPSYLSNWSNLATSTFTPMAEIAIIGDECLDFRKALDKFYHPNKIFVGSDDKGDLPLLENRIAIDGKTTIYVCFNNTCKLPVFSVEEAYELIMNN